MTLDREALGNQIETDLNSRNSNWEKIEQESSDNADTLALKADKTTTYTKTETDDLLDDKADSTDVANALALKADKTALQSEITRATSSESANAQSISTNATNIGANAQAIVAEKERAEGVEGGLKNDISIHKTATMPHEFKNLKNNKTYSFGFQLSEEGKPQIITEEII